MAEKDADHMLERWPGYAEQSWAQRFAKLDRRYGEQIDLLMGVIRALKKQPPAPPTEAQVEHYLVWSNEHQAWWGRDQCGYTRIIANAGRYERSEALEIAGARDGGWRLNKGNPDEIAIPERDAVQQYERTTAEQFARAALEAAGRA